MDFVQYIMADVDKRPTLIATVANYRTKERAPNALLLAAAPDLLALLREWQQVGKTICDHGEPSFWTTTELVGRTDALLAKVSA